MNLVGKEINDMTVISNEYRKYNHDYVKVKCKICGTERIVSFTNLQKAGNFCSLSTCKSGYVDYHLHGKLYGDYKIIGLGTRNQIISECIICHHQIECYENGLKIRHHNIFTCKHDYRNTFIGKQFNDCIIIDSCNKNNEVSYRVKCLICNSENVVKEKYLNGISTKHQYCIKKTENSIYKNILAVRFRNIQMRTGNVNNTNFKHYGLRNIRCEYECFIDFYNDWIDEFKQYTIEELKFISFDRIDVNGNYCKNNLRLVNQKVQSINTTRKRIFLAKKDQEVIICDSMMEFGRFIGKNPRSVSNYIRKEQDYDGWSFEFLPELTIDDLDKFINQKGVTTNLLIA